MAAVRHWIKLYCKLLTDTTVQRWPVGQRYCWIGTLLIAAESSQPGVLVDDADNPLTDSDLAKILNVSRWTATQFRTRAAAAGMLTTREDGALIVRNFTRLQASSRPPGFGRGFAGDSSATDEPSKETRARVSRAEDRDTSLSAWSRDPAALLFAQPTGLTGADARLLSERLRGADDRTPAALMSVSAGLPNAAIADALDALETRRRKPPPLESEVRYFVHVLKTKRVANHAA